MIDTCHGTTCRSTSPDPLPVGIFAAGVVIGTMLDSTNPKQTTLYVKENSGEKKTAAQALQEHNADCSAEAKSYAINEMLSSRLSLHQMVRSVHPYSIRRLSF